MGQREFKAGLGRLQEGQEWARAKKAAAHLVFMLEEAEDATLAFLPCFLLLAVVACVARASKAFFQAGTLGKVLTGGEYIAMTSLDVLMRPLGHVPSSRLSASTWQA